MSTSMSISAAQTVTDAPASIPPAPWRSRVSALLWWHWATPAARAALPQQLASRAGLPITIGGLIAYHEGPVGPYNEVVGSPVLLRRGPLVCHVPFLAVDSAASAAAGRGNWALPKVLASFEFDAGPGPVRAIGDGWELVVAATVRARRFPFAMTVRCVQEWPDGRLREAPAQMRGQAQLARVDVRHGRTSELGEWLVDGRHQGVLISGMQHLPEARG